VTGHPGDGVQLPLDLVWRPALERDAFLVTEGNAAAVAWIDRWPDWPGPVLVLEGPPGSGKTHLASVWQARSAAVTVEGPALDAAAVPRLLALAKPLVVEGADRAPEQPLLHLYNGLVEEGRHLLLTADRPPARWAVRLPDLASRLKALPVATIPPPDDAALRAVFVKLFADRRLSATPEMLDFLIARMERSFDAARHLVARIDAEALSRHRRITVALVREVLAASTPDP
jgi:chromosomal replication initiation ATPase DnaA